MYVCILCMSLPNPQNNKSQINLGLGRNPKSWCYLKQKLVRINCVTEGRYIHFNPFQRIHWVLDGGVTLMKQERLEWRGTPFPPVSKSTKCLMEVLPQWNKKVGMNVLHVSISTKLRCYLQHKYSFELFQKQQNIAITLIRCYLKFVV